MPKKKVDCISCQYFDGENCHKNGNMAILVKYRQERKYYISKPSELNKNKDCKSYVKFSKKQNNF